MKACLKEQDNPTQSASSGFALASVLTIMVVLSILGSMVYRNVGTDITHSGRDVKRVRAEFAAESSIQWALAELSRQRPGRLPFSMATHGPDGLVQLTGKNLYPDPVQPGGASYTHTQEPGDSPTKVFQKSDLAEFPESATGMDKDGWMYKTTSAAGNTISGGQRGDHGLQGLVPRRLDPAHHRQGRGGRLHGPVGPGQQPQGSRRAFLTHRLDFRSRPLPDGIISPARPRPSAPWY